MLKDVRMLDEFGLDRTFVFSHWFYDFELWYTFDYETTFCIISSFFAVLLIILIITANLTVTTLVAVCVGITDLALFGNVYYAGLTLNPLIVINIIVSVGISVDYSAHIAYAYLIEPIPLGDKKMTQSEIRVYKARMALRKMGSSVFHGGFSTFLAILVLAPGTTYIFIVFFRCWFGIIFFGLANGFILLPVLLSFMGPTSAMEDATVINADQSE